MKSISKRLKAKTIIILLISLGLISVENGFSQKLEHTIVDNSTYAGKSMFGYQGWFAHPDDDSELINYSHWGDMDVINRLALEVEMYPDLREYGEDEKYITTYSFPNGEPVKVFSSANKRTVMRHIKWVRDYQTDGVFLQRFINDYRDQYGMRFRDSTTITVKEGCEKYGRVFGIMYDGVAVPPDVIKKDWMHLVDDLGILSSDRYLHHDGKPLVSLWGFTFYERATVENLEELIDWFHHSAPEKYRASIKLGLNDSWLNLDRKWVNAFAKVEVISPWTVGRYRDLESYEHYLKYQMIPGKTWCDQQSILFVPVLFPGFSWHNLREGEPKNEIPRDGGHFFWMQVNGAIENKVKSFYFAMLDEVDEATAFFKTAENSLQAPLQEYWLNLDADGYDLPSDWYLRCAGHAAETLKRNVPVDETLTNPLQGVMTIIPVEENCSLYFIFPDFEGKDLIEISVDGGASFPYVVSDDIGAYVIHDLPEEEFEVFVRHPNSEALPMGVFSMNCADTKSDE